MHADYDTTTTCPWQRYTLRQPDEDPDASFGAGWHTAGAAPRFRPVPTTGGPVLRLLPILLFAVLLAPAGALAADSPLADPDAVVEALDSATPPADLPGNDDGAIGLVTWTGYYGTRLEGVASAWVLIGSTEFPIASVLVFPSPENAETSLGDFAVESSSVDVDGLTAYAIADRGKWLCIAADGAVLIFGQAEPESADEDPDAVKARSCQALAATHDWLVTAVSGSPPASPEATPQD
jgi:hypothetical protein